MSTEATDIRVSWLERFAELRRRYPRPKDLLPTPWPQDLYVKKGKQRLGHLPVYHDFSWLDVFGHKRKTFQNGQSLAELVRKDCPEGKYPALLLTCRDDAVEGQIITETHFIVVVQIYKYLKQASADPAISYFAGRTQTRITGLSKLKEVLDTPEGIETVLPLLSGDAIKKWATGNSEALGQLAEITASSGFAELLSVLTIDDLARILEWTIDPGNEGQATEIVSRLREDSLPKLYTLTGIARLNNALMLWDENGANDNEEFWQTSLAKNSFVLSSLFSFPVIVLKEKAYLGGKGIDNTGGNLVDFLLASEFTRNALLVEIKTPMTPLLGSLYRTDIYNVSSDLSGAVQQCSNYKQQLVQNSHALYDASERIFNAFNPPSLVIVGNTSQLVGEKEKKSFELFRQGLRDIQVITFDELFIKLKTLVELLAAS